MIISTPNGTILSNTNLGEQNNAANSTGNTTANTTDITALLLKQSSNVSFDVSKLLVGNVFQGLITDVRNNQVTIQINGQNLLARLEESINLNIGQNLSFKIQSNDGTQVSIKPMVMGNTENEVFVKVLNQANIPLTERNFQMVKAMMDEQLPVDKKSVQEMVRQLTQFPNENPSTMVQMSKLAIPITQENIIQFENYTNMEHQIDKTMNQVVDEFLPVLSDSWKDATLSPQGLLKLQTEFLEVFQNIHGDETKSIESQKLMEQGQNQQSLQGTYSMLSEAFSSTELETLTNHFAAIGMAPEELERVKNGTVSTQELVKLLKQTFEGMIQTGLPKEELEKLFASKEYQSLLKNAIENNWFIKPEELMQDKKVEDMYKQLYRQIDKMGDIVNKLVREESSLTRNLTSVKSNLEFMNQVNQVMNYVQIPLKMMNQKAHSDLYVFTNKKSLAQNEGKLSALLHLDMDALGPLDIYVQMENTKVDTQFHVEDSVSFDLIMEHAHLLTDRLEAKGYQCTVEMKERQKKIDFVEDFLKSEQPGTKMQRYSFDVRA